MKFTITKSELNKLSVLVKTTQTISDVSIKSTHFMFKVDERLNCSIYGNGNVVDFSIAVENVTKNPEDTGYFNADINQFIQSFEKVYMSSGSESAEADIQANKLIVSNGKSKISVALLDVLDENDFIEAFGALDLKKKDLLPDNSYDVVITDEAIVFMETVSKFITMIGSDRVSGISLQGNKILYSDQAFSIIEKETDTAFTNGETAYIPQNMFSLLASLKKLTSDLKITFSNSNEIAYISVPDISFEAVLSQREVVCMYPEDEALRSILPDDSNKLTFDADIQTLLMKMNMFDGVFPSSQWRWKTIEFYNNADSDSMSMRYNNMCAEVDTDLPISNVQYSGEKHSFGFKLASILLYDYLSKLADGAETVHIEVSPIDATEEHGIGVSFSFGKIKLVSSKIVDEETF